MSRLPSPAQEDRIRRRIESLEAEMHAFLLDFLRIPTVNPPGDNYRPAVEFLATHYRACGYETQFIEATGRAEHTAAHPRVNILARQAGAQPRPVLHFNGHLDVVPAGDGWTTSPFEPSIIDGRIYGRGVSDQKAGIAASLFAVEALRREGIRLTGTVEQSATVDEESGGFAGVAYLAEHGYIHRDVTDYVIITEPLHYDRICLGHRGVYWFEVTTHGRIAHGSMPFLGVNAIAKMADFLTLIDKELKPRLLGRHTRMPVEPPQARWPSCNINSITGGQPEGMQTPCVADRCHAIFDRRFLIEEPFEQVKGEIESLLESLRHADPDFRYELQDLMTVHPVQTDPRTPLVGTLTGAITDVAGHAPDLIASPGTYDQKHIHRLGLIDQCVAYGPGLLALAHQPDEYCRVDHLLAATQTMALTTLRLLGTQA